jgi:hypothetical protein
MHKNDDRREDHSAVVYKAYHSRGILQTQRRWSADGFSALNPDLKKVSCCIPAELFLPSNIPPSYAARRQIRGRIIHVCRH